MPITTSTNQLIQGLPGKDRNRLLSACEQVDLHFGAVLSLPDTPLEHVYFPLSGFISLGIPLHGSKPLETSLIGAEGMLGATLALGIAFTPLRAIVHGPGIAFRIKTPQLRQQLRQSPALQNRLQRYLYVLMAQLARTANCLHFHEIELRLAQRLLMTQDRTHDDHVHLTHQLLADMLGVQRSAVTIAAGALQQKHLIHYSRGNIHIRDRPGLEAATCACYRCILFDYQRQFNP